MDEKRRLRRAPRDNDPGTHRQLASTLSFLLVSLLSLWLFQAVLSPFLVQAHEIPYSEFRNKVKTGQLVEVTIGSPRITGEMNNTAATSDRDKTIPFDTVAPPNGDPTLLEALDAAKVEYRVKPPARSALCC